MRQIVLTCTQNCVSVRSCVGSRVALCSLARPSFSTIVVDRRSTMASLLHIQQEQPTLAPMRVAVVSLCTNNAAGQLALNLLGQLRGDVRTIDLSGAFDPFGSTRRHPPNVRAQRVVIGHPHVVAAVLSCVKDSNGGPNKSRSRPSPNRKLRHGCGRRLSHRATFLELDDRQIQWGRYAGLRLHALGFVYRPRQWHRGINSRYCDLGLVSGHRRPKVRRPS